MKHRKQAVTILDIARQAGVSPSTVSRILNDTTPVAPKKKAAVMEVIERLNYRPNSTARGLVLGKTGAIGILTQNIGGGPFYGPMLSGIEDRLQGSGFYPIFASGRWVLESELQAVDVLLERRIEGLIVLGGRLPDKFLCDLSQTIPLIILVRPVAGLENHCLVIDNFVAAYRAVSYLMAMGHTVIAHLMGPCWQADAVQRRDGYVQALRDAGFPLDLDLIVEGDYTEPSGMRATEQLVARHDQKPFTAIFAANDQIAVGARLALHNMGLSVPEDVSLVGFDDQLGSEYMSPPLTTIRQPSYDMGCSAGEAILALLAGKQPQLPSVPIELIVRKSVARRT
ncbi:MAG: LacI family DNA-binding transcriptional regulator [Aggregatilineales bacterium]